VTVVPETMVPSIREGGLPVVRRPVGRPRRGVVEQIVETAIAPLETAGAISDDTAPPNIDAAGPIVRRPVGRPRKAMMATDPSPTFTKLSGKAQMSGKAQKPKQIVHNRGGDDQEPIQWWVEGWRGR